MAVYVDDMYRYPMGGLGRMKMSHLLADSDSELLAFARSIGLNPQWHQSPGTAKSHFDVSMSRRRLAIDSGAQPITLRQAGEKVAYRRRHGVLGALEASPALFEQQCPPSTGEQIRLFSA